MVTLETGEKLPASIIAMDSQTDIAVIQVKATRPLPVAKVCICGIANAFLQEKHFPFFSLTLTLNPTLALTQTEIIFLLSLILDWHLWDSSTRRVGHCFGESTYAGQQCHSRDSK